MTRCNNANYGGGGGSGGGSPFGGLNAWDIASKLPPDPVYGWIKVTKDTTGLTGPSYGGVTLAPTAYWGVIGTVPNYLGGALLYQQFSGPRGDQISNAPDTHVISAAKPPIKPVTMPIVISGLIPLTPGAGIAFDYVYDVNSSFKCFGLGPGLGSPGIIGGPMLGGNLDNAEQILSGWSVSGSFVYGAGGQVVENTSGRLYGPATGMRGAGVSVTYSVCGR